MPHRLTDADSLTVASLRGCRVRKQKSVQLRRLLLPAIGRFSSKVYRENSLRRHLRSRHSRDEGDDEGDDSVAIVNLQKKPSIRCTDSCN